jgi:hypothetical protein
MRGLLHERPLEGPAGFAVSRPPIWRPYNDWSHSEQSLSRSREQAGKVLENQCNPMIASAMSAPGGPAILCRWWGWSK